MSRQTLSAVRVAGVDKYCLAVQAVMGKHWRSVLVVGAFFSYCVAAHGGVRIVQMRSWVAVGGWDSQDVVKLHMGATAVHARSEVTVGATFWYTLTPSQGRVRRVQVRSVVAVGATVSYSRAVQVRKALHSRSLVWVGA